MLGYVLWADGHGCDFTDRHSVFVPGDHLRRAGVRAVLHFTPAQHAAAAEARQKRVRTAVAQALALRLPLLVALEL